MPKRKWTIDRMRVGQRWVFPDGVEFVVEEISYYPSRALAGVFFHGAKVRKIGKRGKPIGKPAIFPYIALENAKRVRKSK